MAANYLMAQTPQYPYSLLWPPRTNVPGDFSLDDDSDTKTTGSPEAKSRNDMLTDAILFDRLNEDRTRPALGPDGMPSQNPMMGAADPMFSPYANPYYAQAQGQQQQQMNLKQAKDAWDWYQRYQSLSGAAPAAGGSMFIGGPMTSIMGAGSIGPAAASGAGSTYIGGTAGGLTADSALAAYGFGGGGAGAGAGGAGAGGAGGMGAMGALGGLGALAAFAYLGFQEGSRQGRKNDAEAPGEYAAWKAANPNHPLLLQTDAERDDYYNSLYGG